MYQRERKYTYFKNNLFIYAKDAKNIFLEFYHSAEDKSPYRTLPLSFTENKLGDFWNISSEGIQEGSLYKWNVDGDSILDPYARSYTGNIKVADKKSIYLSSRGPVKKSFSIPKKDRIIYEVHIGFFTAKKSYTAFIEKIPYLKELGINVVEFLPIYEWDDYTGNLFPDSSPLKNAWGYNPINFFAATKKYASNQDVNSFDEVEELRHLIQVLHENQIEVILDVVYNHTAEGGERGHLYNFKGIGEDIFYIKDKDGSFANYSGCGNTVNCNNKVVRDMIEDSLLYWYLEMGVDGFRFDLASILGRDSYGQWMQNSLLAELTEHPILSHAMLISESWDLGGYFVGAMPSGWSEWNGPYRDTVRKFIRGDFGQVPELIKRISGSVDIFYANRAKYQSSINFICCHDGFTMWDLVSYNRKYNFENGEQNRDGENNNHSYNHGEEGETTNPTIVALRKQQMKNMMLILFISQGIPMLLMGDEIARTQMGNNNAYCQDNKITWMNWKRKEEFEDVFAFTKGMIQLRKQYDIFRKENPLRLEEELILHGVHLRQPDFSYYSLSIGLELRDLESDTDFYIAFNSYTETLNFELPKLEGKDWYLLTDTSKINTSSMSLQEKISEDFYPVILRSAVVLISKKQ